MLVHSACSQYRSIAIGLTLAIAGVLVISWSLFSQEASETSSFQITQSPIYHIGETVRTPSLPRIYSQIASDSTDCVERLGTSYLHNASRSLFNYCTNDSSSSLYCFRTRPSTEKIDSFCIGTPALFDRGDMKFKLGCTLKDLTVQDLAASVPNFAHFPQYWYETGPRTIFERHVKLAHEETLPSARNGFPQNYTILVRREGPSPINNLFHHLMQIFSVFITLDVLQVTLNPETGDSFYRAEDIENTQVVIFDDYPEGPFYSQWTAFAKRPIMRIKELKHDTSLALENIIVPLPGSANIFWQNSWVPNHCADSDLLRVFSQRMLNFYNVNEEPGSPDRPLVLTFLDRTEKRSLVNKEAYIEDLKASYPQIEINLVDFASLSFLDQLKVIRKTDVLAGIHGAGLTHGIFLRPRSTVVEILPPNFNHKGFRNLANVLGHHYFTTHGVEHPNYTTPKGWQTDDVFIEQDRFKDLMHTAIASMYQRGLLNKDVN